MLGELELANLLEGNRRADLNPSNNEFASPSVHARGHSSPNHDIDIGMQNTDDLTELTLRCVLLNIIHVSFI